MDIPEILQPYADFLQSTARPSNRIIFTLDQTRPWESKLGGCPYLEDIGQYPMGEDGSPMMFLAQINLGEMPPLPDFPQEGLLQFYVENDDCYGLDSVCVVRYIPKYIGTECPEFIEKFNGVSEKVNDALYDFCDASDSRVGGYPYFVQYAPAYYTSEKYVLLLQLDLDDTSGIMFGDSGNCTFLISREELLAKNFSNVEYDWQCC